MMLALSMFAVLAGVPARTDSLVGFVLDSVTAAPIHAAEVRLIPDSSAAPAGRGAYDAQTDDTGRFGFVNVPSGRYLMIVRRIGFRARSDTLTLAAEVPRRPITLRLAPMTVRMGWTGSDSAAVARNRARRDDWGCAPGVRDLLAEARQAWWRLLSPASSTSVTTSGALGAAASRLSRDDSLELVLPHVTDPELCRRAGMAYDAILGAERPHFLVFRLGDFHLVQDYDRGDTRMILDPGLRHVGTYIVP